MIQLKVALEEDGGGDPGPVRRPPEALVRPRVRLRQGRRHPTGHVS